jgi:hypothetical protein
MNSAQIVRLALFTADAVDQADTTDPIFRLPELLAWATDAAQAAEVELHTAKEDYGLIVVQSGDSAFRWCGITYDPAVLQLTASSIHVPLPPDLLTLKSVRCMTSGYEHAITFREVDMSSREFKDAQAYYTGGSTNDTELLYCLVGENTMVLAHPPTTTVAIEISYVARSAPLQIYSTGTVTLVNGNSAVSGGGTAWVADEVRNPVELVLSADGNAPKVVSQTTGGTWVDPSEKYFPVQSIDSDGGLTLAGAWLKAGAAARGYLLATVPSIPPEHHMQIVDALVARIKMKAENKGSDTYGKLSEKSAKRMISDVTERQLDTRRIVEDYVAG